MRKKFFIPIILMIFFAIILITKDTKNNFDNINMATLSDSEITTEIVSIDECDISTEITIEETNEDEEIITTCVLDELVESTETNIYTNNELIASETDSRLEISDNDFYAICEVVEAETHGADTESKIHIVSVILNRVNSLDFPNTIQGVCYQSNQFASRSDIEQSTIDAVSIGLNSGDTVQGALFFCTCKGCWADCNKEYLFTDDIGHSFYK